MTANIFLVDESNGLTELTRSAYDSEDLLQRLIADHPRMLSSAVGSDGELLLVRREHPVPDGEGSAGRWSLDHLFLDRQGVPVLVEVKRASDTRARREVVAQMLDYAANGVAYWPVDSLISSFRATSEQGGEDADAQLAEFLGDGDPEAFWKSVEANLRSGRIRMVFVADEIPGELRRIVEFLNEQMRPAEVLAVEIIQYLNPSGMRTLVPTLLGATERAQSTKTAGGPTQVLDEPEWFESLGQQHGDDAVMGARRIISWMRDRGLKVEISKSQDSMICSLNMPNGRRAYPFFVRRHTGHFETSLQYLKATPAFENDEARLALLARLKAEVKGLYTASSKSTSWPSVPLRLLLNDDTWEPLVRIAAEICNALEEKGSRGR